MFIRREGRFGRFALAISVITWSGLGIAGSGGKILQLHLGSPVAYVFPGGPEEAGGLSLLPLEISKCFNPEVEVCLSPVGTAEHLLDQLR